ncbi:MAG: HU family DNA-binding protein [Cyclobacteriaceae bacterium]
MPIMYKAVPKTQPGVVGGGQIKYYAGIVRERPMILRKFASEISNMSTLTTTDVYAVLESFLDRLYIYLEEGRIVSLGDLGSFSPNISGSGEINPEDVNKDSIRKLRVNFRPGVELKDRLSKVKFEKVSNGTIEQPAP